MKFLIIRSGNWQLQQLVDWLGVDLSKQLTIYRYVYLCIFLPLIYLPILLQKIFTTLSISKIKKRDKSVDNPDAPEEHSSML